MNIKRIRPLLQALFTLLGAGVGAALTAAGAQLLKLANPLLVMSLWQLLLTYLGVALAFGMLFFWFSARAADATMEVWDHIVKTLDAMPLGELISCIGGLIIGFVVAALLSQILHFIGDSLFTTVLSCLLFVIFGMTGYLLGHHRRRDVKRLLDHLMHPSGRRFRRAGLKKKPSLIPSAPACAPKLLDTSALIDGRILDLCKTGFLEGELLVPQFVMDELRRVADSADAQKRARGRRGLDVLQKLTQARLDPADDPAVQDVDVKLLRLAKQKNAAIVTCDLNLCKVAQVSQVRALNLNELGSAMRPLVLPGEEMSIAIVKEGKDPSQGVGYLPDGTMLVVEGGRRHIGQTVQAQVTTALQTSAGRMIFAKLRE